MVRTEHKYEHKEVNEKYTVIMLNNSSRLLLM